MALESYVVSNNGPNKILGTILDLLAKSEGRRVHISCAYATDAGLDLLESALRRVDKLNVVIGAPNVTTYYTINRLNTLCTQLRIADNSRIGNIFNSRLFYGELKDSQAWALVGSVNLTEPALTRNRELGIVLRGDQSHETMLDLQHEIMSYNSDHSSLPVNPFLMRLLRHSSEHEQHQAELQQTLASISPELPLIEAEKRSDEAKDFIRYVTDTRMTQSYKPVLLLAMLKHVDKRGFVPKTILVNSFIEFYADRKRRGLPIEKSRKRNPTLLLEPEKVDEGQAWQIISRYPLHLMHEFVKEIDDDVQIRPEIWGVLSDADISALISIANVRIQQYYEELGGR